MNIIGIYPGTFDPITAGHVDIIKRSLKLVDKLYVGVAEDSVKNALFSLSDRVEMIRQEIEDASLDVNRVEVEIFSGLLVKFAKEKNATISIRGVRAIADFEYEFQMSCMNSMLDSNIETVFLPASSGLQLVSSKLVKEVIKLGGDVGDFVSTKVKAKIINKQIN
jgi:pantetheine-phosphate adenylyltransferase